MKKIIIVITSVVIIVAVAIGSFIYLMFRDKRGTDIEEINRKIPIFDGIESCEWVYKKYKSLYSLIFPSPITFQGRVNLTKEGFEAIKGDYTWKKIPIDADSWLPDDLIDITLDKECIYSKDFTYDVEYKFYFDYAFTFLLVEEELAVYFAMSS